MTNTLPGHELLSPLEREILTLVATSPLREGWREKLSPEARERLDRAAARQKG